MNLIDTIHVMRMFAGVAGRLPAGHLWYLLRRMRNEKPHRFAGQTRINTFFPPYPSQAFERFCEALICRRRVPFSTYLAVTDACPFHCEHCSYARRRPGRMPRGQMLNVVEQIKSLGTCTLGLTGGEPLLRDDLEDLVAAARPEMATIVFTSGHGLSAARARRLASAGVTCVTIGIESPDAAVHDAVRGQAGSFDEAREAVRTCQEAGIYTAISTMATREKIADGQLERLYDLASQWSVGEFRILSPVATGGLAGRKAAMLTPSELQELYNFHVQHNRRRGGPAVACFAYLESEALFGCGAGFHHLFIDAAGEVCPCDLTPLSFGNVTAEPLAEIWRRMGRYFSQPRSGCLMQRLAEDFDFDALPLPLPRPRSEALCSTCLPDAQPPEGYRRLLKRRRP